MSVLVVAVLAAMWAAVLLPPYLRDRQESRSGRGGLVGDRVNALTNSLRPSGAHLPVGRSAAAPGATPLPAGARQPVGRLPVDATGQPPLPNSSAINILGREGAEPDAHPHLHAVTDEEAARLEAAQHDLTPVDAAVEARPVVELPESGPAPSGSATAKQRRKDVLHALLGAAGLTLVAGLALGGPMMLINIGADVALAAYVYLLVQHRKNSVESEMKVAFLPHGGTGPDASAMLAEGGGFKPASGDHPVVSGAQMSPVRAEAN